MMFISHQPIHQFGVTASPVRLLEGWRSASQALAKCAWTVLDCGFLWKWPDLFPHPGKIWNNKSRADLHQVCHPSLGWRADSHTCPRGLMAGLTWWTDKECPLWAGPGVASGRPRRRHMPSHLGENREVDHLRHRSLSTKSWVTHTSRHCGKCDACPLKWKPTQKQYLV